MDAHEKISDAHGVYHIISPADPGGGGYLGDPCRGLPAGGGGGGPGGGDLSDRGAAAPGAGVLPGVIILGVVGYVFFGDKVADAVGIRDAQDPPASSQADKEKDKAAGGGGGGPGGGDLSDRGAAAPGAGGRDPGLLPGVLLLTSNSTKSG
mgnify:CR=1 FL=1